MKGLAVGDERYAGPARPRTAPAPHGPARPGPARPGPARRCRAHAGAAREGRGRGAGGARGQLRPSKEKNHDLLFVVAFKIVRGHF
ncbi:unnamed protein product, partial [Brenthis ino]